MQLSTTTAKRRNSSASGGSKKKRQKTSAFQKQQANVGASIRANVIEWKNVDIGSQLAIAASTSSFSTPVMLNPVGQGTGNNDRIGRKIAMTKLQLRWERWQGTGVPDPFRILVVYDRSPNGATPAITSILSGNGISTPVNLSNTDRFLILMDIYPCAQQGMTELYMCNKENRKFSPALEARWTGSTGGVSDMTTGGIWVFWCNTGQVGTSQTLQIYSRIDCRWLNKNITR